MTFSEFSSLELGRCSEGSVCVQVVTKRGKYSAGMIFLRHKEKQGTEKWKQVEINIPICVVSLLPKSDVKLNELEDTSVKHK